MLILKCCVSLSYYIISGLNHFVTQQNARQRGFTQVTFCHQDRKIKVLGSCKLF